MKKRGRGRRERGNEEEREGGREIQYLYSVL